MSRHANQAIHIYWSSPRPTNLCEYQDCIYTTFWWVNTFSIAMFTFEQKSRWIIYSPHTLSCTSPHKQFAITQAYLARVIEVQTRRNTGGKALTEFFNLHKHTPHCGGREAWLHSSLKKYILLPQTLPPHSPHPTPIGWHNEMCVCHTYNWGWSNKPSLVLVSVLL